MENDLTIPEVLVDPLIAQLRLADRIGNASFAQLMESAARVHARQVTGPVDQGGVEAFYHRLDQTAENNRLA